MTVIQGLIVPVDPRSITEEPVDGTPAFRRSRGSSAGAFEVWTYPSGLEIQIYDAEPDGSQRIKVGMPGATFQNVEVHQYGSGGGPAEHGSSFFKAKVVSCRSNYGRSPG